MRNLKMYVRRQEYDAKKGTVRWADQSVCKLRHYMPMLTVQRA